MSDKKSVVKCSAEDLQELHCLSYSAGDKGVMQNAYQDVKFLRELSHAYNDWQDKQKVYDSHAYDSSKGEGLPQGITWNDISIPAIEAQRHFHSLLEKLRYCEMCKDTGLMPSLFEGEENKQCPCLVCKKVAFDEYVALYRESHSPNQSSVAG